MSKRKKKDLSDKKKLLREEDHLTRPPRLEGVVKKSKMLSPKKKKGKFKKRKKIKKFLQENI